MKRIALFFAAAAFFLLVLAARSQSPYPVEWDPRLDALNVTYHPATDCSAGCWRLVSAEYLDEGQSAGLHHVFAKTLDAAGNQIVDRFTVAWADGSVTVDTKPPPDWGDQALWDCYFPDQGEAGGYRAWAGIWEANSDVVAGMGLPYCLHTSLWLTWRWVPDSEAPTPTPPPTATPTPRYRLGLPIIHRN
jgi:hypothetical protein